MSELKSPLRRTLLRRRTVLMALGNSNTQLYEAIKAEQITRGIKISHRAVAWPSDEIDALVTARIEGRSQAEIRTLVQSLHAQRTKDAQ